MKETVAVLSATVAVLGIIYFPEGVAFAINMMPTPWQCDLPEPPASCYGGRQIAAFFGFLGYVVAAIVAPGIIGIGLMVSLTKKSRPDRIPRGPR